MVLLAELLLRVEIDVLLALIVMAEVDELVVYSLR